MRGCCGTAALPGLLSTMGTFLSQLQPLQRIMTSYAYLSRMQHAPLGNSQLMRSAWHRSMWKNLYHVSKLFSTKWQAPFPVVPYYLEHSTNYRASLVALRQNQTISSQERAPAIQGKPMDPESTCLKVCIPGRSKSLRECALQLRPS